MRGSHTNQCCRIIAGGKYQRLINVAESLEQFAIRSGMQTHMDNILLPNHSNTTTGRPVGPEHSFAEPLPPGVPEAHQDRHMDNMDKGNMRRG
jgi:hypothetical protein